MLQLLNHKARLHLGYPAPKSELSITAETAPVPGILPWADRPSPPATSLAATWQNGQEEGAPGIAGLGYACVERRTFFLDPATIRQRGRQWGHKKLHFPPSNLPQPNIEGQK